MSGGSVTEILRLLDDESFVQLRLTADQDVLLWSDMSRLSLPEGFSQDEIWQVVTAIRRQTAILLPWKSYVDIGHAADVWYVLSRSIWTILSEFEARCRRGTLLDGLVSTYSGTHQIAHQIERDLIAALAQDGAPVDPERVHALLMDERQPQDDLDRLIMNFINLVADQESFTARRIGPGLLEELHYRLTRDVSEFQCTPLPRPYQRLASSEYASPDSATAMIAKVAEAGGSDMLFHPAIRAISMYWLFLDWRPLPSWNALVEVLVRRIALTKWGYPVLGWLPWSEAQLNWERGSVAEPRAFDEVIATILRDCGYGVDGTPIFYVMLRVVQAELDALEATAHDLLALDERLQESLNHNPNINIRQRTIIGNALRSPDKVQRIEPHRRLYGISYATARNDFLGLVEQGYLIKEQEKRAFTFRPHPDLISDVDGSGAAAEG